MNEGELNVKKKFELSPGIAILLAGVLIAGAIVFVNTHPAPAAIAEAGTQAAPTAVNVRAPSTSDHIVGSPSAPIVLIEYADFQCPFCSLIYPSLKNIVDNSNGQIAWVYREFPLTSIHPQAGPAASAAECIAAQLGNKGFWEYADAVFNNQSLLTPQYSAQLATQFGADPQKFASCVSANTYQSTIETDTAEAEQNGGQGTPFTIVYNTKTHKGAPISGALPQAQIEAVIQSVEQGN
jgi:protein-disulfide isomerase